MSGETSHWLLLKLARRNLQTAEELLTIAWSDADNRFRNKRLAGIINRLGDLRSVLGLELQAYNRGPIE